MTHHVERPILWPTGGQNLGPVISAAKETVLPHVTLSPRESGRASAGQAGFELILIDAAAKQTFCHAFAVSGEAFRVKVKRDPCFGADARYRVFVLRFGLSL
jgi:hypothetical protein